MKLEYGDIHELKRDTENSPHTYVVVHKADVVALINEVLRLKQLAADSDAAVNA